MRYYLTSLALLFCLALNAQTMQTPQDVVVQLFVATDQQDWEGVQNTFYATVRLDYSSMNGNPATDLTPDQITDAWKTVLPGFEYTHHQLGNFQVAQEGNSARVSCYGTATHFLPDEGGNVWTVVGTYDFMLTQDEKYSWCIYDMKFNFKYQDGNANLVEKAIKNN